MAGWHFYDALYCESPVNWVRADRTLRGIASALPGNRLRVSASRASPVAAPGAPKGATMGPIRLLAAPIREHRANFALFQLIFVVAIILVSASLLLRRPVLGRIFDGLDKFGHRRCTCFRSYFRVGSPSPIRAQVGPDDCVCLPHLPGDPLPPAHRRQVDCRPCRIGATCSG